MRKRWVFHKGELVEVTGDEAMPLVVDSGALWGDRSYDGLTATDGTDISTRSKHREYMKLNGLTTMDDFKDTWTRELKLKQEGRDPSRKGDIADAVYGRRRRSHRRGSEGDPL